MERPAYRAKAAVDGWQRIFEWYGRYLAGRLTVCSYLTVATEVAGRAKGSQGWFTVDRRRSVYFDHPFHAPVDHTLNIDFVDPAEGPGGALAVELERGVGPAGRRASTRRLDGAGAAAT